MTQVGAGMKFKDKILIDWKQALNIFYTQALCGSHILKTCLCIFM